MIPRDWYRPILATLLLGAIIHVAAVAVLPDIITGLVMRRIIDRVGANRVLATPLPDASARAVVMPSPDLLYAICAFDLATGPLRITASPGTDYFSLALYDRNADNFYSINDRQLNAQPAEILLSDRPPSPALRSRFPTAIFVTTPHATGVMLARTLVLDPSRMQAPLQTQASVRCAPIAALE